MRNSKARSMGDKAELRAQKSSERFAARIATDLEAASIKFQRDLTNRESSTPTPQFSEPSNSGVNDRQAWFDKKFPEPVVLKGVEEQVVYAEVRELEDNLDPHANDYSEPFSKSAFNA